MELTDKEKQIAIESDELLDSIDKLTKNKSPFSVYGALLNAFAKNGVKMNQLFKVRLYSQVDDFIQTYNNFKRAK